MISTRKFPSRDASQRQLDGTQDSWSDGPDISWPVHFSNGILVQTFSWGYWWQYNMYISTYMDHIPILIFWLNINRYKKQNHSCYPSKISKVSRIAKTWKVPWVNGHFRKNKWRYLPYIRHFFKAYLREYPYKSVIIPLPAHIGHRYTLHTPCTQHTGSSILWTLGKEASCKASFCSSPVAGAWCSLW